MVSLDTKTVIDKAKQIYQRKLKVRLEPDHSDQFVAIEPDSGDYFIGNTFDEAVKLARISHPQKLTHTIKIGQEAAFHIGVMGW